ncbi:histidinol dehydrogenase [Actinomadura luteofluorescens]|uniref:histidinol dehydrogenase n=1 Tax=Actinomadura luteofluorescens TaxID=46163 RepID=UPI003627A082
MPGVVLGQRQIPLAHVGAYAPAGRVPMLASPFMTVKVPKVAGVDRVVACTPPRAGRGVHAPTLYSLIASGADAVYCLGGVQAVAAMAFGLLDGAARWTSSSAPATPSSPRPSGSCTARSAST